MEALVFGGLGLVGVGGSLWAASLLFPQAAMVLSAVIRFLSSPVGQVALIVVLMFGAWAAGDIHRGRADAAAQVLADQKIEVARLQRDADAATLADKILSQHDADLSATVDRLQTKADAYAKDQALHGAGDCRLSADDVARLLDIK